MQTIAQLLSAKSTWNPSSTIHNRADAVHTISMSASVLEAAQCMNDHRIGSLIVVDQFNGIAGILTERDILTRVVAQDSNPSTTKVSSAMTKDVTTATPDSTLTHARTLMTDQRIRHLPITDPSSNELLGLISIGDLNAAAHADLSIEVKSLREYITAS